MSETRDDDKQGDQRSPRRRFLKRAAATGLFVGAGSAAQAVAAQPSAAASTGWGQPYTYSTETTEQVQLSATPPSRAPFEAITWGSGPQTDGTYDHWFGMGWNPGVFIDSDQGTSGQPALLMAFEDGWYDGAHQGMEWYVAYFSPDHTSVSLFRPFYCRVQRDNNTQHHSNTYLDIGTDGAGVFAITAGPFTDFFTVTPNLVTFRPLSGNGFFVLDTASGFAPCLQFRNGGSDGFSLMGVSPTRLVFQDKNGRAQASLHQGNSSAAAVTDFFSVLRTSSSIVCGNAPLKTNATDGFLYVPTCAGQPMGTPTSQTGTVPLVFDTTDRRLYVYESGAWHYLVETV